jgi:hypothetical protein
MKTALELLRDEVLGELPPEGWYTINQLTEMIGVRRNIVETLVLRKKWPLKKYRSLANDGKLQMLNHYYTGKL